MDGKKVYFFICLVLLGVPVSLEPLRVTCKKYNMNLNVTVAVILSPQKFDENSIRVNLKNVNLQQVAEWLRTELLIEPLEA